MKKRIFSAILAGTMLCTALGSLVGCKDDPNDFSKLKTDGEMYKAIQTSLVNTQKYAGDVTFSVLSKSEEFEGDKKVSNYLSSSLVSVDPDGKLYMESKYDRADEEDYTLRESKDKVFKQDGKYYTYESIVMNSGTYNEDGSQKADPEEKEEEYTECTAVQAKAAIAEYGSMTKDAGTDLGADSYADLKKAYSDVFTSQVAEEQKTNESVKASTSFSLKNESGKITLKQTITRENSQSLVVAQGGTSKDVATASLSAKNGKITDLSVVMESTTTLDGVVSKSTSTMNINISYSFASKAYDGLKTTLPETVEKVPQNNELYFVVDGVEAYGYAYGYETAAEGFAEALPDRFNHEGVFEWYTDEALTKKLDLTTMTVDQFDALDKVYGKPTVPEGKAYIMTYGTEKSALSEAYETVFGSFVDTEIDYRGSNLRNVSTDVTENVQTLQVREGVKAYVNGTEATGNSFTYTSGFYKVVYVTEATDADFSIFRQMPLFALRIYDL